VASTKKETGSSGKLFYKIGEVCEATDTQPYVLRFWESEFPQLAPQKNRSGQRMYREEDIALVERIKHLLHEEGYTIAGARKRLEQEEAGEVPEPAPQPKESRAGTEAARLRKALGELREIVEIMRRVDEKLEEIP
jgi:DNA-binding transcriptional MerR regulator